MMLTWREQLVARILLLLARMFADDPELSAEIKHLSNHIGTTKLEGVE